MLMCNSSRSWWSFQWKFCWELGSSWGLALSWGWSFAENKSTIAHGNGTYRSRGRRGAELCWASYLQSVSLLGTWFGSVLRSSGSAGRSLQGAGSKWRPGEHQFCRLLTWKPTVAPLRFSINLRTVSLRQQLRYSFLRGVWCWLSSSLKMFSLKRKAFHLSLQYTRVNVSFPSPFYPSSPPGICITRQGTRSCGHICLSHNRLRWWEFVGVSIFIIAWFLYVFLWKVLPLAWDGKIHV